ncbi:hypothetical protein QRX60_40715 [Amycolatopsis mongoliensis]|uniref:Uncharacterized protein n=1 Tax=Amycolatopsis mongoliensis TaxID=715475 RepID=A0A9Y2JLN7_9PSEU|nr:hypothetical protein [Amycolatopsis sp. 4-36]WIY00323.1 hypothetical protein QRX60_40715 [Amycolatopsis sp. 4-36]
MSPGSADDTTRYLCAASYLDPRYSTRAITEFLVEPTRPVPPSPGLDAGRVLTEAVRARARRKNYDGLLVLLMAVVVGLSWDNPMLYGWIALSIVLVVARAGKSAYTTERPFTPKTLAVAAVAVVFIWLVLAYWDVLFGSGSRYSSRYYADVQYDDSSGGDTARFVIGIVLAVVVLMVVTFEHWSLWNLLTTRFKRFAPPAPDSGSLAGLFTEDFREQLGRYQRGDEFAGAPGAPLVVYRGYKPFVGAGFRRDSWSMAIPLERVDDDESDPANRRELTTETLYEEIRGAIGDLRRSAALSPDRRLGGLTVTDAVFTPAAELVDHLGEPEAAAYLPDIEYPPHTRLGAADVERIRREPKEWARYYLCFQVETWDRDLVLTTFLHLAVDDTTLYVEWTPFMLPPIRAEYRAVDKMRQESLRPFGQGLLGWLELPASLPGRIANLVSWIRQPRREAGVLDPERYGAASTLRELASVNLFTDYFQLVDIERYEKIIESRLLPTIGKLLGDAGFSTAKFEEQAAVVINNDITIGGDNRAPITQTGQRGPRSRPPRTSGRPAGAEA